MNHIFCIQTLLYEIIILIKNKIFTWYYIFIFLLRPCTHKCCFLEIKCEIFYSTMTTMFPYFWKHSWVSQLRHVSSWLFRTENSLVFLQFIATRRWRRYKYIETEVWRLQTEITEASTILWPHRTILRSYLSFYIILWYPLVECNSHFFVIKKQILPLLTLFLHITRDIFFYFCIVFIEERKLGAFNLITNLETVPLFIPTPPSLRSLISLPLKHLSLL